MVVQRIMAECVRVFYIEGLDWSHDLANAFGCSDQADLMEAAHVLVCEQDAVFFRQRVLNCVAEMHFQHEPPPGLHGCRW